MDSHIIVCVFVQIANSNPLVSERQDLSVLQREYADDDTVYQLKIKVSQTSLIRRSFAVLKDVNI